MNVSGASLNNDLLFREKNNFELSPNLLNEKIISKFFKLWWMMKNWIEKSPIYIYPQILIN